MGKIPIFESPLMDPIDYGLRGVMTLDQVRALATVLRQVIHETGYGEVTIIVERGKVRRVKRQVSLELPAEL